MGLNMLNQPELVSALWVNECHKPSPSHHLFLIGGIVKPFPVVDSLLIVDLPTLYGFYWDIDGITMVFLVKMASVCMVFYG